MSRALTSKRHVLCPTHEDVAAYVACARLLQQGCNRRSGLRLSPAVGLQPPAACAHLLQQGFSRHGSLHSSTAGCNRGGGLCSSSSMSLSMETRHDVNVLIPCLSAMISMMSFHCTLHACVSIHPSTINPILKRWCPMARHDTLFWETLATSSDSDRSGEQQDLSCRPCPPIS